MLVWQVVWWTQPLFLFGVVEYAPAFYTGGRVVVDAEGQILVATSFGETVEAMRASPTKSLLCISDRKGMQQLVESPRISVWPLSEQDDRILLRIEPR